MTHICLATKYDQSRDGKDARCRTNKMLIFLTESLQSLQTLIRIKCKYSLGNRKESVIREDTHMVSSSLYTDVVFRLCYCGDSHT